MTTWWIERMTSIVIYPIAFLLRWRFIYAHLLHYCNITQNNNIDRMFNFLIKYSGSSPPASMLSPLMDSVLICYWRYYLYFWMLFLWPDNLSYPWHRQMSSHFLFQMTTPHTVPAWGHRGHPYTPSYCHLWFSGPHPISAPRTQSETKFKLVLSWLRLQSNKR